HCRCQPAGGVAGGQIPLSPAALPPAPAYGADGHYRIPRLADQLGQACHRTAATDRRSTMSTCAIEQSIGDGRNADQGGDEASGQNEARLYVADLRRG